MPGGRVWKGREFDTAQRTRWHDENIESETWGHLRCRIWTVFREMSTSCADCQKFLHALSMNDSQNIINHQKSCL